MDFNLTSLSLRQYINPLKWFMDLGKEDTEHIRDELCDLLHHAGESLRTFSQLLEAMYDIPRPDFDAKSFSKIYFYCFNNFTGSHITHKVRTHCTDITRDVNRITFKVEKYLRAEDAKWKSLNKSFKKLMSGDNKFLSIFENDLKDVNTKLKEIFDILHDKNLTLQMVDDAWNRYQSQRKRLMDIHSKLPEPFEQLKEAEQHIREILT